MYEEPIGPSGSSMPRSICQHSGTQILICRGVIGLWRQTIASQPTDSDVSPTHVCNPVCGVPSRGRPLFTKILYMSLRGTSKVNADLLFLWSGQRGHISRALHPVFCFLPYHNISLISLHTAPHYYTISLCLNPTIPNSLPPDLVSISMTPLPVHLLETPTLK